MSNIHVVADLRFKEIHLEEIMPLLKKLVLDTRKEIGCLSYELLQDFNDKTIFYTIELWESQADLEAHLNSDNVKKLLETVGPFFLTKPGIHQCQKVS
jgi:quinol monooxygenase YgiN